MATKTINSATYRIALQPPPGKIVAPTGFPADPRPQHAPKVFLDAMDIRIKVFSVEQKCDMSLELDEDDARSWSWVVYRLPSEAEAGEVPVSSVRMVPPPHAAHPNGFQDEAEEDYVKLTRVVTVVEERGKGLMRWLCEEAFGFMKDHPEGFGERWKGMLLTHAQVSVERMYERLGFVTDEKLGRWDEEGIEHLGMWKRLEVGR